MFVASLRRSGINGNNLTDSTSPTLRSVKVASLRRSGINGNPVEDFSNSSIFRSSLLFGEVELMETLTRYLVQGNQSSVASLRRSGINGNRSRSFINGKPVFSTGRFSSEKWN